MWNETSAFTRIGEDEVGIFLSETAPKMIINRKEYELQDSCWDVEMVKGKHQQVINFYWCGEVRLSVRCDADNELFMPLFDYLNRRPAARHV